MHDLSIPPVSFTLDEQLQTERSEHLYRYHEELSWRDVCSASGGGFTFRLIHAYSHDLGKVISPQKRRVKQLTKRTRL